MAAEGRIRRVLGTAALLALWAAAPAASAVADDAGRRIVAIADIHGAADAFRSILVAAGLADERGRWAGGDALLIQTGDFLDRGADALEVAQLLRELQRQAPSQGGEVVVLLGNHEALNLVMDLRDVTPRIVRPLVAGGSEVKRNAFCNRAWKLVRRRQGRSAPRHNTFSARCVEQTPKGWLEYIEELGPDGDLGGWLRQLPAVVQVGDWLFLHGGLSPAVAGLGVDEINRRVRQEISTFDRVRRRLLDAGQIVATSSLREIFAVAKELAEASPESVAADGDLGRFLELGDSLLLSPDGPLWFRGYSYWQEEEGLAQLPAILGPMAADYLVVGHTPQKTGTIERRFGDRVFLLDTGMLTRVYGGRPSALEIDGERVTAIYHGGREILAEPAASP